MVSERDLPPEFAREISTFTLRVCTPIYWHDRGQPFPKDMQGASCFFLRFEERVVGITADHVVDAYYAACAQTPALVCQVRLAPFDLDAALIDRDRGLDLATFAVSEADIRAIDAVPIDCRGNWPPPTPDRMRAASLAGFPEIMRIVRPDRSAEFNAYGALPTVEDVTDSQIIFTYDRERCEAVARSDPADLQPLDRRVGSEVGSEIDVEGGRHRCSSVFRRRQEVGRSQTHAVFAPRRLRAT